MKVLVFDVSGKGGISHYIYCLCDALAGGGDNVVLATTKDNELDLDQARFPSRKILYPHHAKKGALSKGTTYLCSLARLLACIKREKPDIVHWHEVKVPFLEWLIVDYLHKRNIRVVYSAHDVLHHEKKAVTPSLRKLYGSFDRIIAHAEANKRVILELLTSDAAKIAVVPHGEYSMIAGAVKSKRDARESLAIPRQGKVLLFFGYIRKYKGLSLLLEALAQARRRIPDLFLVIAGEAKEDFSIYEKQMETLGLTDIIRSDVGYVAMEEIPNYFSAADLVVLPYSNIYQSGIVYMAYAYERPVIVTDVGGLPEVVEEGKTGYIVPAGDEGALARAIEKAVSDMNRLEEMGRYGFRQGKEKYSWSHIAGRTAEIYKDCLHAEDCG